MRGAGCWCASFLEEDSLHLLLKTTTYTTSFPSAPTTSLSTQNGALQDGLQVKTKTKALEPLTEFRALMQEELTSLMMGNTPLW